MQNIHNVKCKYVIDLFACADDIRILLFLLERIDLLSVRGSV